MVKKHKKIYKSEKIYIDFYSGRADNYFGIKITETGL